MNKEIPISFKISNIATKQFATLEQNYDPSNHNIQLGTEINLGYDTEKMSIGVSCDFTFQQDNQPYLLITTESWYSIKPSDWEKLKTNSNIISVPKNLCQHLAMISVGTTRGVLHAKTENSIFNEFILPTVNVKEIFENDVEISLKD